MQDRLETYNEDFRRHSLAPSDPKTRERKISKISFQAPMIQQTPVVAPSSPATEKHVPAIRTRKVSKISMFEFVPEENPDPKSQEESRLEVPNSANPVIRRKSVDPQGH